MFSAVALPGFGNEYEIFVDRKRKRRNHRTKKNPPVSTDDAVFTTVSTGGCASHCYPPALCQIPSGDTIVLDPRRFRNRGNRAFPDHIVDTVFFLAGEGGNPRSLLLPRRFSLLEERRGCSASKTRAPPKRGVKTPRGYRNEIQRGTTGTAACDTPCCIPHYWSNNRRARRAT